jgi:hypothetical protein
VGQVGSRTAPPCPLVRVVLVAYDALGGEGPASCEAKQPNRKDATKDLEEQAGNGLRSCCLLRMGLSSTT